LCSPPTTFAGNELVGAIGEASHEKGLQNTDLFDRRREVAQEFFVEVNAWLVRVGDQVPNRNLDQGRATGRRGCISSSPGNE
jgi:hypothetical protein